jgi:uncharacterized RDD family membrane protein YckC
VSIKPARTHTEDAQLQAIRRLHGERESVPAEPGSDGAQAYAGLVTRAVALAIDALIVDGSAALVGVVVGLGVSLLHLPHQVNAVLAAVMGVLWLLWSVGYFVFFWSTTGQTPGARVMSIAVVDRGRRGPLKPRRAALRFLALCAGALALMLGIAIMLWDDRRRCFHDRVARTVVIYLP